MRFLWIHPTRYQNPLWISGKIVSALLDTQFWDIMRQREAWRRDPAGVLTTSLIRQIERWEFKLLKRSDPVLIMIHTLMSKVQDATLKTITWWETWYIWYKPHRQNKNYNKKKVFSIPSEWWIKRKKSRLWRLQRNLLRTEATQKLKKMEDDTPPLS